MQYSVVNYKTVLAEDESMRFDADFYMPNFLKNASLLKSKKAEKLDNLCTKKRITKGETPLWQGFSYEETGIPFVRSQNLFFGGIREDDFVYVPNKYHDLKKRSEIRKGDNLIAIVGATIGVIGYYNLEDVANCNQAVAIIRPDETSFSKYIHVFLGSKIAQKQIKRFQGGNARDNLDLDEVRKIEIVLPTRDFNLKIENLFDKAEEKKDSSVNLYSQAEQLLLSELGLFDWKTKHTLAFVKNFSATLEVERFDAEYFQPKYEEIVEAIEKYKPAFANASAGESGFDELGNLVKIKKSVEPGSEAYQENGVPFVRVSNLSKFELSDNNQQFISDELYNELKTHQPKKGEILLSKDATPGMAYYLNEEPQKMIVSGGILRLTMQNQKVLPEYLTLVLNSVIVQKQIERDAGGSIINHWRPDQVKATLIPILKEDRQKEIKELIEKSFSDRKLSKSLLEIAKRGVEMAIEKDEEEAKKWMDSLHQPLKLLNHWNLL